MKKQDLNNTFQSLIEFFQFKIFKEKIIKLKNKLQHITKIDEKTLRTKLSYKISCNLRLKLHLK